MEDMWNPWHGCKRVSEGCKNCYMYFHDSRRGLDGSHIYQVKGKFSYPLQKNRDGSYKVQSGSTLRVCLTSDFFLKEADGWRPAAWEIIRQRRDVLFVLLTKRPERVDSCLPQDWGEGWENVAFQVTAENQKRTEERMPLLLSLPFRHKGVIVAPFLEPVSLKEYLSSGQIEEVFAEGENYVGARPLDYEWVRQLSLECAQSQVTFRFNGIGSNFLKDGRRYCLGSRPLQRKMARGFGLDVAGRPVSYQLKQPGQQEQLRFF